VYLVVMPPLVTEAVVLHAFDYSETSRILRLATRDAGLVSVLARGARRSRSRFGSALDLFAEGTAELYLKEGRDLQTLSAFDLTRARPALAADLDRFTGASVLAELVLRFGAPEQAGASLYDTLAGALDQISAAPLGGAASASLAGAWRLVAALGFAPSLDACAACHAAVPPSLDAPFSHDAGGVLCAACGRLSPGGRLVPAAARGAIRQWIRRGDAPALDTREARAHQRLLREFLRHHIADTRPLRAFEVWEHGDWSHA
jgi:DNA repair protein RecO (recombination protein O)